MSIEVIISFQTRPESTAAFAGILAQVKQDLPKAPGCRNVRIFGSSDDPCRFTLVEHWESRGMHQAHIEGVVASGGWAAIAAHLAADPVSGYFVEL